MADETLTDLEQELHEINVGIAKREMLLTIVRDTKTDLKKRSDFGWFLTLCEEEVGTIMAVSSQIEARDWGEIEDRIEKDIIKLEIEQKILRRECAKQAKD